MNVSFVFLFVLACYGLPMFWRRRLIPYRHPGSGLREPSNVGLTYENNALRKSIRETGRGLGTARASLKQSDLRFVLAVSVFLLLLVAITRIIHATPTQTDFRYILPLVPVFVAAAACGLMRLQGRRWLFLAANVLAVCFALASLIFYFGL
jgi:hypothetical protein